MTKEQINAIEEAVQEFFSKLGALGDLTVSAKDEGIFISLATENPGMLIGESGQTLGELQHLLKRIVHKRISSAREPAFQVILDVNNYRKAKEEYLRRMAQEAVDEVLLLKKPKELPAMSAFERRIIHEEVGKREGMVSESVGEGKDRRVVITLSSPSVA